MILHICDNVSVLNVMRLVKIVILAIKIIVPIILIVSGILNYLNAIKDEKIDISKANKSFVNRFIAAVAIFLVPTMINLVINITGSDDGYKKCIENASTENIKIAYEKQAQDAIDYLKKVPNETNYNDARSKINQIKDETVKQEKLKELDNYKEYIDIYNKIKELDLKYSSAKYDEIKKLINNVSDSTLKDSLVKELELVKEKHRERDSEVTYFKQSEIPKNQRTAVDYGDYKLKHMYTNVYLGTINGYSFWMYLPNDIDNMTNVPLVVYMHGLGEQGNDYDSGYNEAYYRGFIRQTVSQGYAYNAIIVQPQLHTDQKWNASGNEQIIFKLVNALKKHYSINDNKISLVGFSNGCYGTKTIVPKYPTYFSCVVAIDCNYTANTNLLNAYKSTPFYGIGATDGANTMEDFVKKLNSAGGTALFKRYHDHAALVGETDKNLLRQKDLKLMEWILTQERQ